MNFMYRLIIFGPPGAGKGTQAQLVAGKLNLFHLSTGEMLRNAAAEGTELGKKAKEIMDRGDLVSDEIMIGIVRDVLGKNDLKNGFILDGFPRTVKQAEALMEIFKELNFLDVIVVSLTANEEELVKRLMSRGRSDDTESSVRNRLHVYERSSNPVIDFFEGKVKILKINGVGEIEKINENILNEIAKI